MGMNKYRRSSERALYPQKGFLIAELPYEND